MGLIYCISLDFFYGYFSSKGFSINDGGFNFINSLFFVNGFFFNDFFLLIDCDVGFEGSLIGFGFDLVFVLLLLLIWGNVLLNWIMNE